MDENLGYASVPHGKPIPPEAVRLVWTESGELRLKFSVYLGGVRLWTFERTLDRPKTRGLFNYLLAHLIGEEPENFRDLRDQLNKMEL